MSDGPHPAILDRDYVAVSVRDFTEPASRLLVSIIDNATWVFVRCQAERKGGIDEDLAPLSLYRHMTEMADGIEVLVSKSVVVPAMPPLRSLFEAWLALSYILESPSTYRVRSLSWITAHAIRRLRGHLQFQSNSPEAAEFERDRQADEFGDHVISSPADVAQVGAAIRNIEDLLAKPHLAHFRTKFDELASKNRRRGIYWSELHGGPASLKALAKHMRQPLSYRLFYGTWSETAHALDFTRFFLGSPDGRSALRGLRDPSAIQEVVNQTTNYMLRATKLMLDHFREGEDSFPRWYRDVIRPLRIDMYKAGKPRVVPSK